MPEVMAPRSQVVRLSTAEFLHAMRIGWERQRSAEARGAENNNNMERDPERDLRINIMGAQCELAASLWLPGEWDDALNEPGKPKVGAEIEGFIDVKGVTKGSHRLIVPAPHLTREWAYLLVVQRLDLFWCKGWVWGSEMHRVQELQPGRPAYVVEDDELLPPELLRRAVQTRKGER